MWSNGFHPDFRSGGVPYWLRAPARTDPLRPIPGQSRHRSFWPPLSLCGLFPRSTMSAAPVNHLHCTISLRARTVCTAPLRRYSTPTAREPSKITRVAKASVSTVRFARLRAGMPGLAMTPNHRRSTSWPPPGPLPGGRPTVGSAPEGVSAGVSRTGRAYTRRPGLLSGVYAWGWTLPVVAGHSVAASVLTRADLGVHDRLSAGRGVCGTRMGKRRVPEGGPPPP